MLEILNSRRTSKVIGNIDNPVSGKSIDEEALQAMLEAAGNAPFHYACDRVHLANGGSPVPWRVCSLDAAACNDLMNKLQTAGDSTKVPNMLAAAAHLFLVTWLPDEGTIAEPSTDKEQPVFSGTLRNMEHLAAASAFCQSLLLAGQSAGFRTYWSSGGPLRGKQVFEWYGIPGNQLLIGALFLFPKDPEDAEIKPGALTDKRGGVEAWAKQVSLG